MMNRNNKVVFLSETNLRTLDFGLQTSKKDIK